MSQHIEDVLAVVAEVCVGFEPGSTISSVTELRRKADLTIAGRRGVTYRTVQNAYRRLLEPDLTSTKEFDEVVYAWLTHGSNDLRIILEKHARSRIDEDNVDQFFRTHLVGTATDQQDDDESGNESEAVVKNQYTEEVQEITPELAVGQQPSQPVEDPLVKALSAAAKNLEQALEHLINQLQREISEDNYAIEDQLESANQLIRILSDIHSVIGKTRQS